MCKGMKRRNFLSLLGAAGAAPLLPIPASAVATRAGYNRYMYGLAVFHARTRASISVADLVGKLRVSAGTAEAMMGEMSAKGVLAPVVQGATGAMQAVSPNGQRSQSVGKLVDKVVERLTRDIDAEVEEDAAVSPCDVAPEPRRQDHR